MRLEMHLHTRFSNDSLLCFWPLYIKCLYRKIDAVAVTEHNNIDGAIRFREFCKKHGNKIQVIIGNEILTKQGEIVGLYLMKPILEGLSAEETINAIKEQNGIVYIPHPYDKKRQKTVLLESVIAEFRSKIDCIEVHNGRNCKENYDIKQNKLAEKYQIPKVIGSDAHTWIEVGRNYMCVETIPLNAEEFRNIIKNATFHSKKNLAFSHRITKIVKVIKLISRRNYNELYRIISRKIKDCINRSSKKNSTKSSY